MKPKPQEKTKKATDHPTERHWREMNRKQRRETMRKIQSEDLSLEVVHPDAAGIDIGNESHSRMSYTAIQYTPVDCMVTVRIPHCFSQSAIAFSSAVVHPKRRTGWLSRLGGTAT
jgi:hypothetical protein